MLRRCMTPNPHKKINYLSQLVEGAEIQKKQGQKINYDSFIFVDRLTNNKIVIGEARNTYSNASKDNKHGTLNQSMLKQAKKNGAPQSAKQKQYSQSKQMQEINDCFMLMKSTKFFQMSTLKSKIFTKAQDTQNNKQNQQMQNVIKKKKKIREFIQQYMNQICLSQFRRYMQPTIGKQRVKLINPNLLNLNKVSLNKINKHNIQKIIEQFLLYENGNQKKKSPININIDDIDFPDQQRLKQLLFHHLFIKNKDFQFLVTPQHSKQIYFQIHANTQHKNKKLQRNPYSPSLNEHNFNEFAEQDIPKINLTSKKKWKIENKKIELKRKQLMCAIESGSIYDFLFLIIRWPSLLHYKDDFGNNLLHIAAKQDQGQIYSLLIKKMGMDSLKQKNNGGKNPIELAKLFGSLQVQRRNQEYGHFL